MRQTGAANAADDGIEQRLDAALAVRRLVPDLLRLDVVDRDILLLNAWAGLSLTEVAAALDMPAGTIRSRLHRLRRDLRAAISLQTETALVPPHTSLDLAPSTSGDLT